MNNFSAKAS